jgi:phage shock protein PspC (stress-responsive transcriptional regulator)
MVRSFTDRVFGGVCGGLADRLPINSWTLRLLFVILSIVSLGVFALIYVALWWTIPQQSLTATRHNSPLLGIGVLLIIVSMAGAWIADQAGWLRSPDEKSILLPIILLILSFVFLLRQVRG